MTYCWNDSDKIIENLEETLRRTKEWCAKDGFVNPWPFTDDKAKYVIKEMPALSLTLNIEGVEKEFTPTLVSVRHFVGSDEP